MVGVAPHDLARDTAVKRIEVAPGWYTATLDDAWNFRTPSGGVLMTVALRAMQDALAEPGMRLVSANTHFCSPVPAGRLEIRVEILRHGRAAAQVRAQLSSTDVPGPGLEVSATFGRERPGIDVIDTEPPMVPPPEECRDMNEVRIVGGELRPRFFDNFETRLALGHLWWERDWTPGPARLARWFRYRVPQRLPDGYLDPLAIPPVADTMPPALIQKLGPDCEPFFAPSLDLTIHFLDPTRSEWLLVWTHARRARAGYASASAEIWGQDGALVAWATQTMMLRRAPAEWRRS